MLINNKILIDQVKMSYVIRQEMFGNLNPLMKKYKYDGEIPAAYINAEKRHKIS